MDKRVIKFRAWFIGNEIEKAAYIAGFNMVGFSRHNCQEVTGLEPHIYRYDKKWKLSDIVLMQFTGLLDKNGKEIYEGDIVEWGRRMYVVAIDFNGYCLNRYKLWHGKFVPSDQKYSLSLITLPSKDRFGGFVDSAEVVGNLFENPELIKQS